jgi:hypothetical protein
MTSTAHAASGTNSTHASATRAHMHHAVSPAARSASDSVIASASNSCHAVLTSSIEVPRATSASDETSSDANIPITSPGIDA